MSHASSSPQPARRTLDSLKKHSSATHKNLFGSNSSDSTSLDSPIPHYSPALSSASAHLADHSNSRRSNSSSQSIPFLPATSSASHTPPGSWSVSGKLVRKKASGLFREAARSWGRSKSKEVLSFGLGVLIGNQDAQAANSSPPHTLPPPPPLPPNSSTNLSSTPSAPIDHPHHTTTTPQHPSTPNRILGGEPTIPSSAGTILKGPKKRLSFHSCKKVKGKTKENSKITKRRSEIGFGDWADTLNTAVDSSSPQSQPPTDKSDIPPQTNPPVQSNQPSKNLSSLSSGHMALPYRLRERPGNQTKPLGNVSSSLEFESAPQAINSRVPRSTFPHAHRSPRSPRRLYNTRAAVHRSQSQNLPSQSTPIGETSTSLFHHANLGPSHYQQQHGAPSLLSKRSMSPVNQFEDDFDVESPIASKSHGRASLAAGHRLGSVNSARANLFGAMPNKTSSLGPSPRPASLFHSSTPNHHNAFPHHPLSPWLNGPQVHPTPTSGLPRTRQRTVSATLQEHSSRMHAKHLTTLTEDGCDSDPESHQSELDCPLSSPSRSPPQDLVNSNDMAIHSSSVPFQKTSFPDLRHHQSERWAMPRIEGLDMTPRRRSVDELLDDSDPDEKGELALSSQPSSTTSIASSLTTHESENAGCSAFDCSLKPLNSGIDGFGALPPPESPFPGPHRIKRGAIPPASPNNLKRDVDGELVGLMSQPALHRHRTSGPVPPLSFPNLRTKHDAFEPASPRHSWGLQSNIPSDEDDDDLGPTGHHEPGVTNGSHESHEGASNLSVPALTDSSSLASSLASSNRSTNPFIICPPVEGPAFISSWDKSPTDAGREAKRRSLPPDVSRTAAHSFTPAPPLPMGIISTPLSTKHSFTHLPSPRPLPPSANSSFQEGECSYQNVKPNASAFLSSGMISKKTSARNRRENSLSNSSALFKYALSNLHDPNTSIGESSFNSSIEASIAVKSMCEALGGPRVIVAAQRATESQGGLTEQHEQSLSMQSDQESISPNQSSLGIVLHDSLRPPPVSSLRMPDTPMKKPVLSHKLHPHVNKPFVPSRLSKLSNSHSPLVGGSSIDSSPTSLVPQFSVPESPIPQLPLGSSRFALFDGPDPSPSFSRVNTSSQIPLEPQSLVKQSPTYRRRSSDGVPSSHTINGNLNNTSGSRPSNPFDDPGTPTKAAAHWLKRAQLLSSPGNSISSVTSSPSMLHHAHPDRLSTYNSSVEHLLDPQVTPNRQGGRSYTPFALSPMLGMELRPGTRSNLTPGPGHSASPPPRRPSFHSRHSSPIFDDFQRRANSILFGQVLPRRSRYDTEFDELETLGKGEFGEVFKVRQNSTGKVFAIKRPTQPACGPKALARQYEEVDILRRLTQGSTHSPYIIQLHAAWEEDRRWNMQIEYCENGTLEHFLGLIAGFQDRIDEERIWKITSELTQAVAYMHSSGVLHLDIKPANILITAHGGLKVGDFGLARRWPRINPNEVRECGILNGRHKIFQHVPSDPSQQDDCIIPARFLRYEDVADHEERHMMRFKRCGRFVGFDQEREGDREYIAPEILSGRYGEEADVFSVGLIVLEIATNVVLPDNGDEWLSLRSSDFSRTDLSHLSSELVLLIKRMMDKCPDRRITAAELARHPVIAKLKTLRDAGLAQEMQGIMAEGTVEYEETEALESQADHAGDILMSPGDDSYDLSIEHVTPLRPAPPAHNTWLSARGAVLPEAEGFLPFILTGESTPSRLKISVASNLNRADETGPRHFNTRDSPAILDQMEIDV